MGQSEPLPPGEYFDIAALPQVEPVTGVVLRDLGTRPVYELRTPKGIRLVDATDGAGIRVDEGIAREVASMMNEAPIRKVSVIAKPNLESRRSEEHTSGLQSLMRISYAVFCLKQKKPDYGLYEIKKLTHK